MSLAAQLRALADEVEALEAPTPPPPPPEPEPGAKPEDIELTVDPNRILNFQEWNVRDRYLRELRLTVLSKPVEKLTFDLQDLQGSDGGGRQIPLQGTYKARIYGTQVQVAEVIAAGEKERTFIIDTTSLPAGWSVLEIVSDEPADTCALWPVFKLTDPMPEQRWIPLMTTSLQVKDSTTGRYRIMWVPAVDQPTVAPLAPRDCVPFSHATKPAELWRRDIVPAAGHPRHVTTNADGIISAQSQSWYTYGDFVTRYPRVKVRGGPRGVANIGYVSHLQHGTAVINGRRRGNVYGLTPWNFFRADESGAVRILSGWEHTGHWQDPAPKGPITSPDQIPKGWMLRGRWQPGIVLGMREAWGGCWVESSLALDESVPPVLSNGEMLQPHSVSPRYVICDQGNNRLLANDFDPKSHDTEPYVSELVAGLDDPFDVVRWDHTGNLIVSERGSSKITERDPQTGALIRVVYQGPVMHRVDPASRFVIPTHTLPQIRAAGPVGMEGLYICPGDDWLYMGSSVSYQAHRLHLVTGEIQLCATVPIPSKRLFLKIAVSDGSFGPAGTLFVCDWTVARFGMPYAFLPDGKQWPLTAAGDMPSGVADKVDTFGYSCAVGVGFGELLVGSSQHGIVSLSLKQATDPSYSVSQYRAGERAWSERGYDMTHGKGGYGQNGLPLPWGESPEIDYYLQCHGHTTPERQS
ncbi:hypothetical protein [Caudoviricetes sp.]|nr:hypothetical protein [Caudoviricetes sp.]